ncbi:MAG: hypothetical protein Kow0097_12550 [Candidatus Bipolaricaulota bacterium]
MTLEAWRGLGDAVANCFGVEPSYLFLISRIWWTKNAASDLEALLFQRLENLSAQVVSIHFVDRAHTVHGRHGTSGSPVP